jgi:hypothetical protein
VEWGGEFDDFEDDFEDDFDVAGRFSIWPVDGL